MLVIPEHERIDSSCMIMLLTKRVSPLLGFHLGPKVRQHKVIILLSFRCNGWC